MIGLTTAIKVNDGGLGTAGGAYTALNNVEDIKPPESDVKTVDESNLGSGEDMIFISSIVDNGKMTISQRYSQGDYVRNKLLQALCRPSSVGSIGVQIVMRDGLTIAFTGIITKMGADQIKNEPSTKMHMEIQVTGAVTITQGLPTVTSVTPATGPAAGGTAVVIKGTGFMTASAVKFGTTAPSSFTVVDDNTIDCSTPAVTASTVHVTVTNGGGTSATSSADQFVYT